MAVDPVTGEQIPDAPPQTTRPMLPTPGYTADTDPVFGTAAQAAAKAVAAQKAQAVQDHPDMLESFQQGAQTGARAVLNFPSWLSGTNSLVNPTTPLGPAAQQAHPNLYGAGQFVGEAIPTTAALLGGEALGSIPVVGDAIAAASKFNPLVRMLPGYTGGTVGGIAGNLLTGADNPNQTTDRPRTDRIGTGCGR